MDTPHLPAIDQIIFTDYQLGPTALSNRVVMAPMTRCRAIDNIPSDLMATYYSQRSGAGLIITEGTAPSADGLGYARIPGIYSDEQVAGWKKVTHEVHEQGGKIFLQIMHCGRVSHPDNMEAGTQIMAPSAIAPADTKMYVDGKGELEIPVPKAMTTEDISQAVDSYRKAARNAIQAGFDGVEIHGANGYLINQFINPGSNQRDDHYGGSIENRTRFVMEVVAAVIEEIGADRTGIRLSPYGVMNDMSIYDEIDETFLYLATQLNRLQLQYIHLVDHESMGAPAVPEDIKRKIRVIFNQTLILSGGYDKARANKDLEAGHADLIAIGRPYIANPDLVGRFVENARLAIPQEDTFYTPGEKGYIDYPYLQVD